MPSGPETANGAWVQSLDQKAGLGWARLCWASWRSLGRKFRSLVEVGTTAMAETAWVSWFTQVHSHLPGLLLSLLPQAVRISSLFPFVEVLSVQTFTFSATHLRAVLPPAPTHPAADGHAGGQQLQDLLLNVSLCV